MNNKSIVIIDDDKEFLDELRETLEMSGYSLVALNDPVDAVQKIREIDPLMIFLDLKMPKKNGFFVAEELKEFKELSDIPIITMSAYYKPEYDAFLKFYGISRCLRKPFQPLDIIAVIEEVLKERGVTTHNHRR